MQPRWVCSYGKVWDGNGNRYFVPPCLAKAFTRSYRRDHLIPKECDEACAVVRKVHEAKNGEVLDIAVSYDGTWQRRGHVSLNAAAFVIDILTGLVVDYVVLSKHCPMCAYRQATMDEDSPEFLEWKREHVKMEECQINYIGSSGGMEPFAAEVLWKRSEEKNNMRYTTMLSDGDAKTHEHVNSLHVYGPDVEIKKEECINHVSKRMSTGLKNLVQEWRVKKVTLGGRGVGTLKENIVKLTSYYRLALVQNLPDIARMERAIWATVEHSSSTDQKPNHDKCPEGEDSLCFYNRSIAKKEDPGSHKNMNLVLNDTVAEKIRPLYTRLTSKALLERCSRKGTQNANESLHNSVWQICSKNCYTSKSTIEVGVARAVSEFNMGYSATLEGRKWQERMLP